MPSNKQTNEPGRNFFWLLFFLRKRKVTRPAKAKLKAKIQHINEK
jgi:hypothetical protein